MRIKHNKELLLQDLNDSENNQKILQICNIDLKTNLKKENMIEIGPGKYFDKKDFGNDLVK